jgi:hypothetical protein
MLSLNTRGNWYVAFVFLSAQVCTECFLNGDLHPCRVAGPDHSLAIRNQQSMGRTSPPSRGRMVRETHRPQDTHRSIAHHPGIVLGAG